MFCRGLANFNVQLCRGTDPLDPRVLIQPANTKDRRFVKGFSFDFGAVADSSGIEEAHDALSDGHFREDSIPFGTSSLSGK